MEVYVLDGFASKEIIEVYQSCIWNVQFFGMNDFQFILPGTQKNIDLLQIDTMLVRSEDVTPTGFENVMVIESRYIDYDIESGWVMTIRGRGLKSILNRRIVWTQTSLTGKLENCIRQVISQNIINSGSRKINDFVLDSAVGINDNVDIQLLGENIGDWLSEICQEHGIGWDVYIKNSKYVFRLKKGTDRTYNQNVNIPVVFSAEYDNLSHTTYTQDRGDYKNAALIGGEGEGTEKRTSTIGTATGLSRYETYIDGSGVSSNGEIITEQTYYKMLQDYGKEQLTQTAKSNHVVGEVIPNGMYSLNEDYFLGDLVQIVNSGISAVTRITEVIYSEDENGSALVPTFSDWEG